MKKKIAVLALIVLLMSGCGSKIPTLSNGDEAVVTLKNGSMISANELYEAVKDDYALEALVNLVDKKVLEEKINKYEEATKAAILKEDTEKAQSFVKQKLELQEKVNQTDSRIKEQDDKISSIKVKIEELEIEISKMKSKKQELATRLDVAQINNEINETLAGLNDDHGINLDELEKKVAQKENYGNALEQLKPKDEDQLLDEYIKNSPSTDSKVLEELERIKDQLKK